MQLQDKIDSKVMTDVIIKQFYKMDSLTEVRFNDFTADVILIHQKKRKLVGVEIKSDKDSPRRLKSQLRGYLRWFHAVYVACTLSQLHKVLNVLKTPEFASVGVLLYMNEIDDIRFDIYKKAVPVDDIVGVNANWISKQHQLYQYKWLLDEVWNKE